MCISIPNGAKGCLLTCGFPYQQYTDLKMPMASPIPRVILRLGQPFCHWFVSTNKSHMQSRWPIALLLFGERCSQLFDNNKRSSLFPCSFKIIQVNSRQSSFDSRIKPKTTDQRGKTLRRGRRRNSSVARAFLEQNLF